MKTFIADIFIGQPSSLYNKQGRDLEWIKLRINSSEADLPFLPKITLNAG